MLVWVSRGPEPAHIQGITWLVMASGHPSCLSSLLPSDLLQDLYLSKLESYCPSST